MADEYDLDNLDSDNNRTEKRIKDLSDKVRLTSEERDEQKRLLEETRSQNENLVKERDFLNSFGDQLSKHPEASGFKDQIKERVLKGYSMEDATAAVLVANGKYNSPAPSQPSAPLENILGGSSTTVHQTVGAKSIYEMSREEKRAQLLEAQARGDLGVS